MKELDKILEDIKKEITYDNKGEGYISQRGIARLVGVHHKTIQTHIKKESATLKLNKKNQLHEGSLLILLRSIGVNNTQVIEIVEQIEVMGVRSVFHGVATPIKHHMTQLETYKHWVKIEEERIIMLDKLVEQKVVIDDKKDVTDEGEHYYTISRIKKLNPRSKFSGMLLTRESVDQEIEIKTTYAPYNVNTPNAYHEDVWFAVYPQAQLT